jgi:hypothetical protein
MLGWLAPWWLRPEVVHRAAEHQPAYAAYLERPSLPAVPGGCWALLVQGDRPIGLLKPAFLLPLCWRRGEPDDSHLPAPLCQLAGVVRGHLDGGDGTAWGLHLARPEREEARDLSGLGEGLFGEASAWASLAGGLLLGRDGVSPHDRVWASAAWDDTYGIGRVDGLAAKLDLAAEWRVERLFVPAQNQPEASAWRETRGASSFVELLSPVNGAPAAECVLEPYLEVLGVEPGSEASWEVCQRYHARVGRQQAEDYYWHRLLAGDVERCRQALPPDCRCTHLATWISSTPSVAAMAPMVLGVKQCLLLHLGEPRGAIATALTEVSTWLAGHGVRCTPARLDGESFVALRQQTCAAVLRFAAGVPGSELAFDLTPGFKTLTLALAAVAPPGSWLVYCRHQQQGPDHRVVPGTQVYDCWRKEA